MDGSMIFTSLKQKGLYRAYEHHIVRLNPVLERMSARGMPVDPKAFAEVVALLERDYREAYAEMQRLVPDEVKARKWYKRQPREGGSQTETGQWFKLQPWKPSNQALIRYITHRGHPIPFDAKTQKNSTKALEVARLSRSTRDPLYSTVIHYRKAQTILKDHVRNWKPDESGRVHTSFYFDPATGQLSSRNPNIQNAPKHDDPEFGGYGRIFRSMVRARPGHTILEFDFKSFHAQTLAFEAQDADYLRLAKLDIHSYLAAHLVRDPDASRCLSWDDERLRAYLAGIKKAHKFVRDNKAKRAILGYGFGMGAGKLYDMNRESFDSKAEAKRTIDMLNGIFPIANRWRDRIRQKAHDQGYLISRHGYIRYFWEVLRWKGGEWKPGGDDSEAAIAFLPANDAFGEIKDRILTIVSQGLDERYGLINTVHDSLVFECPDELISCAVDDVRRIMEAPSKVLIDPVVAPNGLSVEVDVQGGPSWGEMRPL
jgi:DNA polymerase I-like protein with 3'-5' exonuclease and polymerase domains